MNGTRIKTTLKNTSVAVVTYAVSSILGFVCRAVFIQQLGMLYLGASALFSNIFTLLALSNMGIAGAIEYALYEPLALKQEKRTNSIMQYFTNAYWITAALIAILGLAVLPFLDLIIADSSQIPMLSTIYVFYLLDIVSSYLFASRRTLLIADQKHFLVEICNGCLLAARTLLQIVVLLIWKNLFLYLAVQILFTLLTNLTISYIAKKKYAFLSDPKKEPLQESDKKSIWKNIRAMFLHHLSLVVINGTDIIILAGMIGGLAFVGLYSNYLMIITIINMLVKMFYSSLAAVLGEIHIKEDAKTRLTVLDDLTLIGFWLYGFCSICLYILISPFISVIWLGANYVISNHIVFLIVINFYVLGVRQTVLVFRGSMGLFYADRYKAVFEAIANIVFSIILAKQFGFIGVFVGTLLSMLVFSVWFEPLLLFRKGFGLSPSQYYLKSICYFFVTLLAGVVCFFLCSGFVDKGIAGFAYSTVVCLVIPNVIFALLAYQTATGKRLFNRVTTEIKNVINRES